MPTKKPTKRKPTRHSTFQDAEREAIQAGLRRAARRETAIRQLVRRLSRMVLTTNDRLHDLAVTLAERSGSRLIAGSIYRELEGAIAATAQRQADEYIRGLAPPNDEAANS